MKNKKLHEAYYIRDLVLQKDHLIFSFSKENLDSLWTDCSDNLPDVLHTEYDPTYLQILVGMDNLLEDENSPHEEILKVKEYISKLVDNKLSEVIEFLKNRVSLMNKNISSLKKKFEKDWGLSYDEVILNEYEEEKDKNFNIDDILDKINARGMSSLTKDEKNFLKYNGRKDNDDKKDE